VTHEQPPKPTHGRWETRTLWALHSPDLNAYLGSAGTVGKPWPGVAQVCRIQRVVRTLDPTTQFEQITNEVAYAITSLHPHQADAANLTWRWRWHWGIENRLHWVRDVTFGEDASPIHVGQAPEVFALLRNVAIPLLRRMGAPSIPAAQRDLAVAPNGILTLFASLARTAQARLSSPSISSRHHQPLCRRHPRTKAAALERL
jgi:predicted transposase YbfD/YdcC